MVDHTSAREIVIAALKGGNEVGHSRDTIPLEKSEEYVNRFEALFDDQRDYYIGMGFGDRRYVFMSGMAIISKDRAGVLWVVESD